MDVIHSMDVPPLISVLPFILLLLAIAFLPLIKGYWWESHKNKAQVIGIFSLPILLYLLFKDPFQLVHAFEEYIAFILLLGSLYTISGGIALVGEIIPTPAATTLLLGLGMVLANLIGTTGASMLLIRPLLKIMTTRKTVHHTVIFFIFLVSNIGGCLTPLGDPPLFLGYLNGVPFTWTFKLWKPWLLLGSGLLTLHFVLDYLIWKKENPFNMSRILEGNWKSPGVKLHLEGKINFVFLFGVVLSVAFLGSPYREIFMIGMGILSILATPDELRARNSFTYDPIYEVAILFLGIFITMQPALLILRTQGQTLGITEPWQFFWISGTLSSFLDNAPTYLTFFNLAKSLGTSGSIPGIPEERILEAISLGSVFMGANTYIGNGPNFMVKSVAEATGVKMPTFFGYMLWSMGILIPSFLITSYLFFD
ncbi:MAG TPA: sodium:proton antiporter [Candidatus Limnocylindrales bacterium]|nr:sodium:proton antiporter [Candidatus Limnocylindrales bacterium]